MSYMSGIAGMLARGGQQTGAQIGNALAGIGANVGGLLSQRQKYKEGEERAGEVQALLQEHSSNPAKLNSLGREYETRGDEKSAQVFYEAAKQAVAKETKGQQRGIQGGLQAITQAAMRGVPLYDPENKKPDLRSAVQSVLNLGGTQAQIMEAYKAGTGGDRETVSVSPGGALVDKRTGKALYERDFKPQADPASKGIKTVTREDGSVSVLDADDGSVISTLPPPGKGEGDRDAALNLIAQTTSFIQDVDKLMDPGFMEEGFVGGVTAAIPGTPAYDREKELLSIRARLGFDQINEMKRLAAESGASGTGLGQISNIEFMSLQSTIDAIYTGMSREAQNEALRAIKKHLLNVQKLASGVAPADAIEWEKPEYKAVGYHKDPETGTVFYAPDGPSGTVYKLVDGKFVKLGAYLGSTRVE